MEKRSERVPLGVSLGKVIPVDTVDEELASNVAVRWLLSLTANTSPLASLTTG
jgi:hypothetical protein